MVDTKNHKYQELAIETMINSGGINFDVSAFSKNKELVPYFEVMSKVLPNKIDFAFDFVKEIITTSDFSDKKHVYELLAMFKSQEQMYTNHCFLIDIRK